MRHSFESVSVEQASSVGCAGTVDKEDIHTASVGMDRIDEYTVEACGGMDDELDKFLDRSSVCSSSGGAEVDSVEFASLEID